MLSVTRNKKLIVSAMANANWFIDRYENKIFQQEKIAPQKLFQLINFSAILVREIEIHVSNKINKTKHLNVAETANSHM